MIVMSPGQSYKQFVFYGLNDETRVVYLLDEYIECYCK